MNNSSFLVGVVVVLLIAAGVFFFARDHVTDMFTGSQQEFEPVTLTGFEAADRLMEYVGSQQVPGGYFTLQNECVRDRDVPCQPGGEHAHHDHESGRPSHHYGHIILALDDYAEVSGDVSHKNNADTIMNYVVDDCLNNSELSVCEWNYYSNYRYFKETQNNDYLNVMLQVSDKMLDPSLSVEQAAKKNAGIKLWMLYDVTGDERYRDRLVALADGAIAQLDMAPATGEGAGRALRYARVILMPAHQATGEARFLRKLEEFFTANDITQYVLNPSPVADTFPMLKGVETLLYLSKVSEAAGPKSFEQAVTATELLLRNRIDWAESKYRFAGDSGMLDTNAHNANRSSIAKDTLLTGQFVQILLELGEYSFTVTNK